MGISGKVVKIATTAIASIPTPAQTDAKVHDAGMASSAVKNNAMMVTGSTTMHAPIFVKVRAAAIRSFNEVSRPAMTVTKSIPTPALRNVKTPAAGTVSFVKTSPRAIQAMKTVTMAISSTEMPARLSVLALAVETACCISAKKNAMTAIRSTTTPVATRAKWRDAAMECGAQAKIVMTATPMTLTPAPMVVAPHVAAMGYDNLVKPVTMVTESMSMRVQTHAL